MERTATLPAQDSPDGPGLAAELRESLLLLAVSVGLTGCVTLAAQAATTFLH